MSDLSAAAIEKEYVERTGSDDFDVPGVATAVRSAAGLGEKSPEELAAVGDRAIDASDLSDEDKAARKRDIREALGLDVVESPA